MNKYELDDSVLENVNGGMTVQEVTSKIDQLYGAAPKEIVSKIKEALNTYGFKAAYSLAVKLTKGTPWKGICNLIPH